MNWSFGDNLFSRTGRFGCFAVVSVVLGILFIFAVAAAWLLSNANVNRPLPDFGEAPGPAGHQIPLVSPRIYTTGSAQATVVGSFQFSDQIEIDPHASYTTPNGESWISFIDWGNPDAGEILVVFNEPENSVTVTEGTTVAMGRDDACNFDIQVMPSSVSGSVSCASVEVMREGQSSGTSSIQLQFSTTSVPWDGASGEPDPYDDAPTDEPTTP